MFLSLFSRKWEREYITFRANRKNNKPKKKIGNLNYFPTFIDFECHEGICCWHTSQYSCLVNSFKVGV